MSIPLIGVRRTTRDEFDGLSIDARIKSTIQTHKGELL